MAVVKSGTYKKTLINWHKVNYKIRVPNGSQGPIGYQDKQKIQ